MDACALLFGWFSFSVLSWEERLQNDPFVGWHVKPQLNKTNHSGVSVFIQPVRFVLIIVDVRKEPRSRLAFTYLMILFQEEYAEMAALLEAGVTAGFLRPVIAAEFPLSSAAEAHREVIEHKQGSCGKIVLTVWASRDTTPKELCRTVEMYATILCHRHAWFAHTQSAPQYLVVHWAPVSDHGGILVLLPVINWQFRHISGSRGGRALRYDTIWYIYSKADEMASLI